MVGDESLRQRLLAVFRQEAADRLRVLADGLAMLEQSVTPELLESLYREIHSLKGAARAVALTPVEKLCQSWESLFSALKHEQISLQHDHLALSDAVRQQLQQWLMDPTAVVFAPESLCQALEQAAQGQQLESSSAIEAVTSLVAEDMEESFAPASASEENAIAETMGAPLEITTPPAAEEATTAATVKTSPLQQPALTRPAHRNFNSVTTKPTPPAPARGAGLGVDAGTLRVSAGRLDAMVFHLEELQQVKLEARDQAQTLREAAQVFTLWRRQRQELAMASRQLRSQSVVQESRVQNAVQVLLDFADWASDYLGQWEHRLSAHCKGAEKTARGVSAVCDSLQQEFQSVLLLPCTTLVEGVPAMVRDIAAASGKQVHLQIQGESLQVDKRILDELRSPLQHLLRNAIDHGIEPPLLRRQRGKPEKGRLCVSFQQESGGKFELQISDDGSGIDAARLKEKVVALGLMDADQAAALSDEQAYALVFTSGITTSTMITDLSGRGLGLAIVQEKVERLGGEVSLHSQPGQGCTFTLRLSASLATYRALLVNAAERLLALPAYAVERVLLLPVSDLKSVENRMVLPLNDQVLPLWRLADVLQLGPSMADTADTLALVALVVLKVGEERFALQVDTIVGDQEITVKPLGHQLRRVRNVMGASPLGDGRLVPILHPQDLYKSACLTATAPPPRQTGLEERRKRILIAEDSVTSRGLLKNILESAGYSVTTTSDGLEAWNALKQSDFDLLLSDIEMPRMDGFVLTTKVRADRALSALPVVLVTALQSPEDRARGLEAGANAYIVKSGFDQTSLLDTLKRLL